MLLNIIMIYEIKYTFYKILFRTCTLPIRAMLQCFSIKILVTLIKFINK